MQNVDILTPKTYAHKCAGDLSLRANPMYRANRRPAQTAATENAATENQDSQDHIVNLNDERLDLQGRALSRLAPKFREVIH
jgi:hypothetical protein